jgi:FkbM family methyltransferase
MVLDNLKRVPEVFRAMGATSQWPDLVGGYLRLTTPYPLQLKFRNGDRIVLQNRADLATLWLVFFPPTYPLLPTDTRIVDCGANIGAFSLYAATRLPQARVISVEPFPETYTRFSNMIRENNLQSRVTGIAAALTGAPGKVYLDDRPEIGSQFRALSSSGVAVEGITLQALLEQAGWDRADLLKLDIEGGEYNAVLATAPDVLRRFSRISMEYHPDPRKGELLRYLEQAGFRKQFERDDGGGYGIVHMAQVQ